MALPDVAGWVVDFRTARGIFASGSNRRINHTIDQCVAGNLHICHCEEKDFKSLPALKAAFISDQNCVFDPGDQVMNACVDISNQPICRRLISGNKAAIFITAIAAVNNFGVISDHRSTRFATVCDLCAYYGIPVFSADEYFDAA